MKITGQVLFLYLKFANHILFISKNDRAKTFSYNRPEGAYIFFQAKNHGAKTFFDEKKHGAKTFLGVKNSPKPGLVIW